MALVPLRGHYRQFLPSAARRLLHVRDQFEGPVCSIAKLRESLLSIGGWGDKGQEVEEFRAALVMLASAVMGSTDAVEVSQFCAVPLNEVKLFARRLRANWIWRKNGQINGSLWNDPVALIMDAMVATGKLGRVRN